MSDDLPGATIKPSSPFSAIERLLREGHTYKKIAKMTGAAKSTVARDAMALGLQRRPRIFEGKP